MSLNIDSSTSGVNASGMKQVVDAIQLKLIDQAISTIDKDIDNIVTNVSSYWVGESAESFKTKIKTDATKIKTVLKIIKAKMPLDMGTMGVNVASADAQLASAIFKEGFSSGAPSGGGTPTGLVPDEDVPVQNIERDQPGPATGSTPVTSNPNEVNEQADNVNVDGNDNGQSTTGTGTTTPPQNSEVNEQADNINVDGDKEEQTTTEEKQEEQTSTQEDKPTEEATTNEKQEETTQDGQTNENKEEQTTTQEENKEETTATEENKEEAATEEKPAEETAATDTVTPVVPPVSGVPPVDSNVTTDAPTNAPVQESTTNNSTSGSSGNATNVTNVNGNGLQRGDPIPWTNVGTTETEFGNKIVEKINAGSGTPLNGQCQGWVHQINSAAGYGGGGGQGAIQAYQAHGVGTDTDWRNIPVGACVYGTGGQTYYSQKYQTRLPNKYGHVGIHIGNGIIKDNYGGTVREITFEQWCADQAASNNHNTPYPPGYVGWGFNSTEAEEAWRSQMAAINAPTPNEQSKPIHMTE